jgi:Ca-activated chloride channel family protein
MKSTTRIVITAAAMAGGAFGQITGWSVIFLHGKVTMEDGSPPPKLVVIERTCSDGNGDGNVAYSDKQGLFTWRMEYDNTSDRRCNLKANLPGYQSNSYTVPDMNVFSDPNLPPLVLTQKGSNSEIEVLAEKDSKIPLSVLPTWNKAQKAIRENRLPEAERLLEGAVKTSPKFAQGWNALAIVLERQNKPADAFQDYRRAIEVDPKLTGAYESLARLSIEIKDWQNADQVSSSLIKMDTQARYPEARLIQAMARYQLKDMDGAIASATETIRLDAARHRFAAAEYVLALSLANKKDYVGGQEHMKKYLALLPPSSPNANSIRQLIADMDKTISGGEALAVAPPAEVMVQNLQLPSQGVPGEAWVPGGRKALAQAVGLKDASSYQDFFTEYCRALAREMTVGTSQGIPQYLTTVRTYMATVTDLLPLGQRDGDITKFSLSLATDPQRKMAERVLALLGWKLISKDSTFGIEPGDQPADGPRQRFPKLFGIDEVAMQQALQSGKSFQFEIPTENARLVGGNDWSPILKQLPTIPGGIAAAFTQDVRLAKTAAGLGAMSPDAASAVLRSVGVSDLVLKYSDILARYGEAMVVEPDGSKQMVALPGGAAAEPAWRKVVGANPHDPPTFFRALVEKNEGRLAAFYYAVWSADELHQKYLTASEGRTERFYGWYRDSEEFKFGINRHVDGWHTELLQKLPLEAGGNVHLPGGRKAWTEATASDDEVLLGLKALEALVPVANLERDRGTPLDEASVNLLATHYAEWKSLFPYFAKLPALGHDEFASLQSFAATIAKQPQARQNQVMGEWYSIVELVARGSKAGSLDGPASARAFRRTCEGLATDNHSAAALAALREIAPGPNLTESVANLLRLSPERRSAFQRVLELQGVPRVDLNAPTQDPAKVVTALSGYVYAASVDPDALLISEDPRLLSRHQFVTADSGGKPPFVFAPAALVGSNSPPGSFLKGGFGNFDEIAHTLVNGGRSVPPITLKAEAPRAAGTEQSLPLLASTEISSEDVVFRASGRLVEAYATVTDGRGKYVDDLPEDQFTLLDGQQARALVGFESHAQPVSVALLLDTTGSMSLALPALKNAALKLIGEMRPVDSVAVYSFNKSVKELQPFTTDMDQAKRAVLSTEALGETALYDALARVARDLSGRAGKKVIVVFTDGDDNSSTLTTDTAILRAKATGVPLFTIAEGEALENKAYLAQLADLAKATGGEAFAIKDSTEIGAVFEKVSEDLAHGYLLEFEPPSSEDHAWHPITIQVRTRGDRVVRAREGYYPQ